MPRIPRWPQPGIAYINGKATPEYRSYYNAKNRCKWKKHPYWHLYGGRGIKFLLPTFHEFLAILGRKPSPKHSLDRFPNTDGDYVIGNVRWATPKEQAANTRRTPAWCRAIKRNLAKGRKNRKHDPRTGRLLPH